MTEYGSISARLVGSEDEDAPQVVAAASVEDVNSEKGSIVTGSSGSEDALQVAPKPGEKEEADSSLFHGRCVAVEEPSLPPVSGGREVKLT